MQKMERDRERIPPSWVKNSVYGARVFYFAMYACYYYSAFKYASKYSKSITEGDYIYLTYSLGTHLLAIYFFLTTGSDPGWADEHTDDCVAMIGSEGRGSTAAGFGGDAGKLM